MHPAMASLASGGIVFTILRRLGAVRDGTFRPGRSIALVVLVTWVPLAVLTALDGTLLGGVDVPFLHDPAVHARLLLAVPLLLIGEVMATGAAQRTLGQLRARRLLDEADEPALQRELETLARARDSRAVELAILVGAAVVIWAARHWMVADRLAGGSSWIGTATALSRAGTWYLFVDFYVSLVLGVRWAWWLVLWTRFVAGFLPSRLRVMPGHPDGRAGLGFLTTMQSSLAPVLAALCVTVAGRMAGRLLHESQPLATLVPPAVLVVVISLAVMFGPLFFFAPRVERAMREALLAYDRLGQELVSDFSEKWVTARDADSRLLGDAGPSTLIDFAGAYAEVRKTRPVPLDPRRAVGALVAVVVPFLLVALLEIPAAELLQRVVKLLL